MSVIYVLLPVAVLFAAGALALFLRSVRKGQFDDLDTPAVRMLHDDDEPAVRSGSSDRGGPGPSTSTTPDRDSSP